LGRRAFNGQDTAQVLADSAFVPGRTVIGGMLFTSRLNAGIPTAGTGYELSLDRGKLLAVNAFHLQISIGALILAAVASEQWQGRRT